FTNHRALSFAAHLLPGLPAPRPTAHQLSGRIRTPPHPRPAARHQPPERAIKLGHPLARDVQQLGHLAPGERFFELLAPWARAQTQEPPERHQVAPGPGVHLQLPEPRTDAAGKLREARAAFDLLARRATARHRTSARLTARAHRLLEHRR